RAGHHRDRLGVARHHALLADHLDPGKVRVTPDMVRVRLRVDQPAEWPTLLQAFAPARRVNWLLRRVDHEDAVTGADEARIAAPEVDLGKYALGYASHGRTLRHPFLEFLTPLRG